MRVLVVNTGSSSAKLSVVDAGGGGDDAPVEVVDAATIDPWDGAEDLRNILPDAGRGAPEATLAVEVYLHRLRGAVAAMHAPARSWWRWERTPRSPGRSTRRSAEADPTRRAREAGPEAR